MAHNTSSFLVIGAGISGLLIARCLHDAGRRVRVLEKGRGCGGRMATRRGENTRFDHGAQYFTVRDPRLQRWNQAWLARGVVRQWFERLRPDEETEGHPRYIGARGISDIPKSLAEGLDLRTSSRAVRLDRTDDAWTVHIDDGGIHQADHLILTAPIPQALELLGEKSSEWCGEARRALRAIGYAKSLAVMALLDGPSGIPNQGALKAEAAPLTWLGDNQQKGISERPAITLHSDADWAEQHWESPDEASVPPLLAAARPFLRSRIVSWESHRWGFAFPHTTFGQPFFYNSACRLLLAGDGFGGPRIEGAALSGLEAGNFLLEQ
ncbi:MAG: FAD-dependent oxidoreductase [Candidatus Hydrogenedentota bacterium]